MPENVYHYFFLPLTVYLLVLSSHVSAPCLVRGLVHHDNASASATFFFFFFFFFLCWSFLRPLIGRAGCVLNFVAFRVSVDVCMCWLLATPGRPPDPNRCEYHTKHLAILGWNCPI